MKHIHIKPSPELFFSETATDWPRLVSGDLFEWTGPYKYPFSLARTPIFFPYNPQGDQRKNSGIAHTLLATHLPLNNVKQLPEGIADLLKHHSIPFENIDCFISVQDRPWKKSPLCFRPHPWMHPDAPQIAPKRTGTGKGDTYSVSDKALVGVSHCDSMINSLSTQSVVTHGGSGQGVRFSPNNMVLMNLTDHTKTDNLYSLCIDPKTKRAAVTLHVLLNDRDHHIFVDFLNLCEESQSNLNLENFITLLEDSGTGVNFDAWRQFADLPKFVLEPMVFEKELSEIDEVSESEKTVTTVNLPQNLVEFLNSESYSLTDLNARNGAGFTPLTRAIFQGDEELVKTLLIFGADPTIANGVPRTPSQLAIKYGTPFIQRMVQRAIQNPDLFEEFYQFIKQGQFSLNDLDRENKYKLTPLTKAIFKNNHSIVALLLEMGADPLLANGVPRTPRQLALKYGDSAMVALVELAENCKKYSMDFLTEYPLPKGPTSSVKSTLF